MYVARSGILVLAATFVLAAAATVAAQHRHETTKLSVGKTGEVTLATDTQVADITLKPGRYRVDHRVAESVNPRRVEGHYIHFTEMSQALNQKRQGARTFGNADVAHPGEIECRLEALTKPAMKTTVFTTRENGVARIMRVEIAGESVAHVF